MTVTTATLGERALRRLGVAVVPVADRPALSTTVPAATIATNALIELGVIATSQVPPTQAAIVSVNTIATNALVKLGVISAEETPTTADLALATAAVDAVHNALIAQGAADWTEAQISTAVAEEYAQLAAQHLAAAFGKQGNPQLVQMLEERVAGVSRVTRAQALALAKVGAVHDSMVGQAFVRWDINSIPQAVSEEYTKLTALDSASSFGKQADPQLVKLLEGRVRQIAIVMQAPDEATDAVQQIHNDLAMRGLARWTVFDIPDAVGEAYVVLAADNLAPAFGMDTDPRDTQQAMISIYRYIALPSSGEPVQAAYF